MDGNDEYDSIPVAEVKESVEEWLTRNEPLSRADLNTVESTFMRTVGEPARMESSVEGVGGMTEKNPHMRVASADAFGLFAYEEDVVLIELDETIACGEIVGYPAGDNDNRWVPVLFCLEGPVSEARDRMEFLLMTTQSFADGDVIL